MNTSGSRVGWILLGAGCLAAALAMRDTADAQDGPAGPEPVPAAEAAVEAQGTDNQPAAAPALSLWQLLLSGGVFMIPLGLLSVLAATFIIERAFALRRRRVIPPKLVQALGQLTAQDEPLDPRQAYQICQQFPSAAAKVIQAMLLRVGRPHAELERAVAETSQREAERLHGNVRWLTLAAAVSPLLGLLGTVWGLIQAFYDTTQLAPGTNKAEQLAQGIYLALVTTFSGLVIAIPSAIFAHYYEGRLQRLFHQIDEMVFHFLPHLERYEGRVRFSHEAAMTPPSGRRVADRS